MFIFGISAQYLSWILPLAILQKDRMVISYSIAGLIALLGFYLYINPLILTTHLSFIQPYQGQFMLIYVLGNLMLLIICLKLLRNILLT